MFSSFAISVFVLKLVQVYPVPFLIHFISAAIILLVSLALMAQFSLPCNRAGRASVNVQFYSCFYLFQGRKYFPCPLYLPTTLTTSS